MTGSNRLSASRWWRSLLRRPTPRTTSETHAWLTTLEKQALVAVAPARVLRRPDSCDEFELALGEAMTAAARQLRSGASARHERLRRGGTTLWPGTHALATRTHEAYGTERYNEVRKAA
jgi:hypothetical protein